MSPDPKAEKLAPFSPAETPSVRPYLPPVWAHYVDGDFYGLQNLATQLYDLARKGNPLVDRLRVKVNEILDKQNSARWSGQSAEAFEASYGQDASMMSALDKIVCAVAGIVDHLAERLASIEHAIEQEVDQGLQQGYFVRGSEWAKTNTPEPNLNVPGSLNAMNEFVRRRRIYQEQALKARELAAQELLRVCDVLLEMLKYYQGKGKVDNLDPGGLLRQGQVRWYSPRIEELDKQLQDERKRLERSKVDAKTVGADMQRIGGGAEVIGGYMGMVGPLKPAGETVSSVGGVVSQLGEITTHFGK